MHLLVLYLSYENAWSKLQKPLEWTSGLEEVDKGKDVPLHTLQEYEESSGVVALILNLGAVLR
jgi:hypothetical protein